VGFFHEKDMEVLMKTNFNTIFFLYSDHDRASATLSGPLSVNKTRDDRKMTVISRKLIYESKANDIFWVLQTKLQGKKQLEGLKCAHRGITEEGDQRTAAAYPF
jgi:hypothetical protein